jgi:glycosyltransferase involved in cell wall biosynthesis
VVRRTKAEIRRALATRRARPAPPGELRLTVVIPAYQEASRIAASVAQVRQELGDIADDGGLEVLVVDDGSHDATAQAAADGGADRVIAMGVNRGKGAAVRAGMLAARGRTIVFTDADLSYPPAQIAGMVAQVEDGWDVVVGNRHHPDSTTLVPAGGLRRLGGRAIHLATRAVLVAPHSDTQCGLKAFRSDVARRLFGRSHVDGFAFDVEIIHLVERDGCSLLEVPVEVANSDRSTVHVVRDALALLADLARIRRLEGVGAYDSDPATGE